MFLNYLCPRCGKETEFKQEYGGLCEDCYLELHGRKSIDDKPLNIKIDTCKICGAIKYGNKWIKAKKETMEPIFINFVKRNYNVKKLGIDVEIRLEYSSVYPFEEPINIKLYSKDGKMIDHKLLEITPRWVTCQKCNLKQSGEYWEYIIRIRYGEKRYNHEDYLSKILSNVEIPPNEYIKIVRVKNGLDIYFTDKKSGRMLLDILLTKFNVTPRKFIQRKFFKALEKTLNIENVLLNI